ncbi:protein translocase subunit secA [Anaerobranca californiensis DSM 14826]|jgi:preprotein translocase subunit SecA|uniref:Protein translocase subunit SecA n=1 Tax=Anaerobranca californiensis DSM 14826 TaxID=1120989 RepID=A0A1M6PCM1_9FIRM|nr:preprotein translocase subunit SecA [Anaerobranca californiensis]SHK05703.1 protein translocase subunit secA [Anaerobranca californiensis DSM 14826]
MLGLISKIFGSYNDREIKGLSKIVQVVNGFEEGLKKLSDEQLRNKTFEFKDRLAKGETLDDILPEAFAVVREASRRTLGMRHFDVQILGGIVLHQGRIAEMKTGEGKTLVATLPAYLNALEGKGVHVVTVNDYLATRDSQWMGKIYEFLGLKVGLIVHGLGSSERREAYGCDITYGTNNEFGFDYLRDNMALYKEDLVQRDLHYAIIDEVDSILIDEARTPLIISGQVEQDISMYYRYAKLIPKLKNEIHYSVDEKANTVVLTEEGIREVEQQLGIENLYDDENMEISHHINQALRAHVLMKRDRDYVVQNNQVIIVDEFTGRLMHGRRYSNGLHQAIEAKEGVKIERESQTLASITYQNYFRMYKKLAGMTGTALTEEEEFRKIYGLDVVVIPTNLPMIRLDLPDVVYRTEKGKFQAVIRQVEECYRKGQPVLVGTISIEKSELLSEMLKRKGIPHTVLNAKYHEKEAEIVAQAGQRGAVTIATNMAGRGTDIVLGEGVKELGGLYIIGTERHESRRIDNQLRGRAGRQGDPGVSQFYISLEDDLMRLFGSEKIMGMMDKLGMDDNTPIEHPLLSKTIENAQKRVEARNFDIRKHVLQYDDVMNQQREVIYKQRKEVLLGEKLEDKIIGMIDKVIERSIDLFAHEELYPEDYDLKGLLEYAESTYLLPNDISLEEIQGLHREEILELFKEKVRENYQKRKEQLKELMEELERVIVLRTVDRKWMEQISAMDELRQGIGLRAFGQKDPLIEYKFEAYNMFQAMIESIQEEVARLIFRVQITATPVRRAVAVAKETSASGSEVNSKQTPVKSNKVGRNDPCPCGSGKKYKKCCG